jgi:hypothetical protein
MPTPKAFCSQCKKKMTYDAVLSIKKKNVRTFWCVHCSFIIVERIFDIELKGRHDKNVGMPVTSVRRYIFHSDLPDSV